MKEESALEIVEWKASYAWFLFVFFFLLRLWARMFCSFSPSPPPLFFSINFSGLAFFRCCCCCCCLSVVYLFERQKMLKIVNLWSQFFVGIWRITQPGTQQQPLSPSLGLSVFVKWNTRNWCRPRSGEDAIGWFFSCGVCITHVCLLWQHEENCE